MMIQIFDIQDRKVIPGVACHMVPELKAIMTNFPDEYLKVYHYIFGMTCPDGSNWYVNMEENQKEEVIISDIKPFDFWLEDMSIAAAIEKCRILYETPTLRIRAGAKMMLDEMANKLREPLTFGKDGNATDMRGIMKEIKGYNENYMHIEQLLEEEQAKVRGGSHVRYDQLPGYKNSKED